MPATGGEIVAEKAESKPQAPDFLEQSVSRELGDVWQSVAGKKPRKARPATLQASSGSGTAQGQIISSEGPGDGISILPATSPGPDSGLPEGTLPASGGGQGYGSGTGEQSPTSGPAAEIREQTAAEPEVREAAQVAAEAASGTTADPAATQAATTETAAQQAATQQAVQAQEQQQTQQAQAAVQQEAAAVEHKEAEVERHEQQVSHTETKLTELQNSVAAKTRQVQELHGRVREKENLLSQLDADINAISSAEDYLEHADEVERLTTMRYHVKVDLDREKAAALQAEADLKNTQREAGQMESSLYEGKRSLANKRYLVSKQRSAVEARRSHIELRHNRVDSQKEDLAEVEALRPFWAALRDGEGFDEIAEEAASTRTDITARDQDANHRILANVAALGDPDAAVDLVGGFDISGATRGERALAAMQVPLEKVRSS